MPKWKVLTGNKNPPLIREIKCYGFLYGIHNLFNFKYVNFLYFDEETYIDEDLNDRFTVFIQETYEQDKNLFWQLLSQEERACKRLLAFSRHASKTKAKTIESEKLLTLFRTFCRVYRKCTQFLILNVIMGDIVEQELDKIVREKQPANANLQIDRTALFALNKETWTAKFTKELLMASLYSSEEKINNLVEQFSWLQLEDGFGTPFTSSDIKQRLIPKQRARQKLFQTNRDEKRRKFQVSQIFKNYNFSCNEKRTYDLMQKIIYYRAKINEDLNRAGYNILQFFYDFADRYDLSYTALFYLSAHEVTGLFFDKTPSQEEIKQRMYKHAVCMENGNISIMSGEDINTIQFSPQIKSNSHTLQGRCAHPGKITSAVIVINSLADLQEVKEDHILVTKFITPSHIPAMQKASAVVTDIGGATSHGAILARELGKPCIIGAQNATETLKTNDKVTLDAQRGIIRKLHSL